MKQLVFVLCGFVLLVSACAVTPGLDNGLSAANKASLMAAVDGRDAEKKARDMYRNPQATLEFFGITPEMSVAEVLPGGGWYTEILAPYLAENGAIYGLGYSDETWPMFGFFSDERIAEAIARTKKFPDQAKEIVGGPISAKSSTFGSVAEEDYGTIDAVLFIRALHNLNRFEEKGGTLTEAINDTKNLLKDGGIVGVVQHWAPESAADDWADGSAGYLKESHLIEVFENAGFELADRSMVNQNLADNPTADDVVWRLPPSLNNTAKLEGAEKEAMEAKNKAIGESNRITLKFVKR